MYVSVNIPNIIELLNNSIADFEDFFDDEDILQIWFKWRQSIK